MTVYQELINDINIAIDVLKQFKDDDSKSKIKGLEFAIGRYEEFVNKEKE